ncbi:MAG: hypothetical protein NT025_01780 [bacterium]|nr:hypothetical protein [bacterium]
MHHTFNLCRLIGSGLVALLVVLLVGTASAQTAAAPDLKTEFDRIFAQIVTLSDADLEVPQALYDRYFELQRNLYPIPDERHSGGQLDQGMDGCPGTVITQPPPGQLLNFYDDGQINFMHDNCTYPRCRRGNDVHYQLVMNHPEWLLISTCGSVYDTYLCVFRDSCCADTAARVMVNNNAPQICGTNALQAAISACFLLSGTYYITLDALNSGTTGDYQFRVQSVPDSVCEVPIPCTQDSEHVEAQHPNDGVCESGTRVECGDGYCGAIDRLGDRDVYYFTLSSCKVVTLSAFADDTRGQSGYNRGLDPALRLFSGPACDHPIYTNDNVGTTYPDDIAGNDARIVTTGELRAGTYWLEITGNTTTGKYEFLITCRPCAE